MTISIRARVAAVSCLLTCATWSLSASAQYDELEQTDDGYEVHFRDGDVLGNSEGAEGFIINLRGIHPRVLFIRPRASFVSEMLESVETM